MPENIAIISKGRIGRPLIAFIIARECQIYNRSTRGNAHAIIAIFSVPRYNNVTNER